ncbi:MAG TPA: J domain-containing protein [Candidatus Dormibacteraeota bacterium]|nr:J domain-containing protein [Candidatus Dormibacteraeota bacterium]
MPLDPEANRDAYRTLGLQPGASKAEVKRAYRLLAKAFHPDSAGEAALPRFLAIHEAYDRLTTGRVGPPKTARPTPAEPWRADPARARQARERARTAHGTAGGAGSTGRGSATGTGSSGRGTTGSAGGGSRGSTGTRGSSRRHVRKATMGSTSYDEARDANDPTWSGASWYGPSSGEYWIVNPREYADPRKHGPEYQSRARRPLPGDPVAAEPGVTASGAATETVDVSATGWTEPSPRAEPAPRSPSWGSSPSTSSWSTPSNAAAGLRDASRTAQAGHAGERASPRRGRPAAPSRVVAADSAFAGSGRAWLGGPADDPIRRLGFALVAWPPIGLAAAALIATATGCGPASTTCGGGVEPLLPLLAQAGILGALLLFAPLTRILAGGAFSMLVAVVPLTLLVIAIGGIGALRAELAPAALLALAWLVGVAWAAFRAARSRDQGSTGTST